MGNKRRLKAILVIASIAAMLWIITGDGYPYEAITVALLIMYEILNNHDKIVNVLLGTR